MNYVPGSSVMPFESSSRISRQTNNVVQTREDSLVFMSASLFDNFFTIIDELQRFSPPNSVFVIIQIIISLYLFYFASFFPFLKGKWNFSYYPDKALRYLCYPIDLGLGDSDIFYGGIVSYLILIFCAIIFLYLMIIILYYQRYKIFPRKNVHIIRFIISFIIPILLYPSCYNIGFSYNSIFVKNISNINDTTKDEFSNIKSVENKTFYITSTVFGFLFYFILISIYYIDIMFRSSTSYIENTALSMWDGKPLFLSIFGSTLNIIFSTLINRFPSWANYFLISCYLVYNFFICYQIIYFPMIKQWMNVIFFTFVSSSIFSSFFQLFPIKSTYRFYIPIGIFIIHFPIVYFIFRIIRNRVVIDDIETANISTEKRALRYLRLTIADRCTDFVSFRWIKPMNQKSTTNLLTQMAQIISFFPSESQNLTFYISLLAKKSDLSLHQRFLFYQIRRVHILRQSNTSRELNDDLYSISKVTNQSILSFSQFLIKIIDERHELTIDSLNSLVKLNRLTDSLYHEAMSRYPNNSKLIYTFAKYVIECHADFKKGISLYHEAQMIERGRKTTIDYAFQSMVNLFPSYLWNRVLDHKGKNIINRKRSKSGSSMSFDSMHNDKNNDFSDTDLESNEKIGSSVLKKPKLRFALKKAVSNMNSKGIIILTLSTIFQFLLSLIISIVVLIYASGFLASRRINYENIVQIGVVRKSIDLSLFRMAKLWSRNLNLSPKQSDITSSLGPEISLEEFNNITVDLKIALVNDVLTSIKEIETLGRLLSEVKYSDSIVLNDTSTINFDQFHNISFCSPKEQKKVQSMTSLRYFSLYLLDQIAYVASFPSLYSDPTKWKDDKCMCEVISNMNSIINLLNDQSTFLVYKEEEYSSTVDKQVIFFFCIAIPLAFAGYIILFIAGFAKMNYEFKQIFDVLSLLPIKIYKEASQPIALLQLEEEQSQESSVFQIENSNCQKMIIVSPVVIGSVAIICCLASFFYLILDTNTNFNNLVKWLEIGSRRTPLLIETITNCILSGIFGYVGDTNYSSHVDHLNIVYNYSQRLLYLHKELIWGSETSTSCNNFSEKLDYLHFTNTCAINYKGDSFRVNYRCLSLDQQIMTFNKFAKDFYLTMIYAQLNSNESHSSDINLAFLNILNGYETINLHFLGITYLLPKLEAAQDILNIGINLKISQLKKYSIIISLCTLAIEFIIFIINLFIINNLKEEFNIVRILIARLPPISVVQNQSLVELMTGQFESKVFKNLTPLNVHITNNPSPIITFNKNGQIQFINYSTSKLFGLSREQLYQSNLLAIINSEDYYLIKEKCKRNNEFKEIQKSKENNYSSIIDNYNDNRNLLALESLLLKNDNDSIDLNKKDDNDQTSTEKIDLFKEPCKITIVGIKNDGTKLILSAVLTYLPAPDDAYVLILNDQTKQYINLEEIKRAKLKIIDLMEHVLPLQISQNVNITENISFSIKQVSVITIKILNLNDTFSSLTSVQAIRSMTELFTSFDNQLVNYQTLTKSTVMSGSYQVIGGLFNSNSIRAYSPQTHEMNENIIIENNMKENDFNNNTQRDDNEIINVLDNNNEINDQKYYNEDEYNSQKFGTIITNINNFSNMSNIIQGSSFSDSISSSSGFKEIVPSYNECSSENNASSNLGILKHDSKMRIVHSRNSIYDISQFHNVQNVFIIDVVLDSLNFAFDILEATDNLNNATGSNFIIGVGINIGGPVTAGTLGKERMQFEVIGEAIKNSHIISNFAEAGSVLITSEIYDMIKEIPDLQKNFAFSSYKKLNLLHMKKTDSFVVKLVDNINDQQEE